MKSYLYLIFTMLGANLFGQFKQIPSGTTSDLTHLSVVKDTHTKTDLRLFQMLLLLNIVLIGESL